MFKRTYALKTEYAWTYSIAWSHVDKFVEEIECFDRENKKNSSKISAHTFLMENTEPTDLSASKTGYVYV